MTDTTKEERAAHRQHVDEWGEIPADDIVKLLNDADRAEQLEELDDQAEKLEAGAHLSTEERWERLMTDLNALRENGVPLDHFRWDRQVIEEVVPGQPHRSKRPGAKLTYTLTFFDPVDPEAGKACGIKEPTTEPDNQ